MRALVATDVPNLRRDSHYPSGRARDWVKTTCTQRETLTAGFALDGSDWDGIYLGGRKGDQLVYAGEVDQGFDKKSSAELRKRLTPRSAKRVHKADREEHLGGAGVERRDRVSRQVRRGEGPPSFLQGPAGGSVMDVFDRYWHWANKPPESTLTIPADIHHAITPGAGTPSLLVC